MNTITRDPDSGVVDQCCVDLDPEKVGIELAFCLRHNRPFMGKPLEYWRDLITDQAQKLADDADPQQYELWEIHAMEIES